MVRVEHTVFIDRPIDEVFEFLVNPENNQLWQQGVIKSRKISEGPVRVGSQGEDNRKYLGREFRTTYEIVECEPVSMLRFQSLEGPIKFEGRYDLEASDGGTRFRFTIQGEARAFSALIGPLASRMARKQIETDAASLKKLLESHQHLSDGSGAGR